MTTRMKKILTYVTVMLFFLNVPGLAADSTNETKKQEQTQAKKTDETQDETQDEIQDETQDETQGTPQDAAQKKQPFFKSVLNDHGRILTSPFRIKTKQLLVWGGVLAVTGVMIANDEAIYREFKKYQGKHKWVDDISPSITKLGLGEWNLGIAGAFHAGGLIFKSRKARETARLTLMTFIHTSLVVQLGKHIFGRQRPSWEQGIDRWHWTKGFAGRYEEGQLARFDAFPSGHTISIFGTATVVAEMYKKTVWVPILSYGLATLCGLSRVTEDTHWLSDVFLAAALGYAIGKFVVKRRNRLGKQNFNIYPVATSHQIGLGFSYVF